MDSTRSTDAHSDLALLDSRINAFLPPRYQHCYGSVSPTSMGSAGLIYGPDGKVAWGQIWTSFCDLAMAGGPPHRGRLLEPASETEIAADPGPLAGVIAELERAIGMTTGLPVVGGYAPGWLGVRCGSVEEAAWLQFAVIAENVSARRRGAVLQLPVGPAFRVEKEIKNVVVSLAKAYHYWDGHLTAAQQTLAGDDLWEPATRDEAAADPIAHEAALGELERRVRLVGPTTSPRLYPGWVGIETWSEEQAVWLLRAMLVERVPVRREGPVLYLPVAVASGVALAARVGSSFGRSRDLWRAFSRTRRG